MEATDMLENVNANFDLVVQILSLYLAVTSAYLIVAFMAGERLTNSQAFIISVLYIFIASLATYGVYSWISRAFYFTGELKKLNTGIPFSSSEGLPTVLAIILLSGILACLKFMWDVRRTKSE